MNKIFDNGGMKGIILDISSTEQYIIGTQLATLTYVGGQVSNLIGTTSSTNITFNLTGGTNSTPQTGDLVIVLFGTGSTSNRNMNVIHYLGSYSTNSYTEVLDLYVNSSYDTNLYVGYSFMGSTPATGITLPNGTYNNSDGAGVIIHVWRNVDISTPLDATTVSNTSDTTTGIPNPPAITTQTNGSVILVGAASAHNSAIDSFSSSELSNFLTAYGSDNNDSTVGMGSYLKSTAGSFDPATFTASYSAGTNYSSISFSLALKPATVDTYGNYKNSGIWNLKSVFNNKSG